MRMPLFRADVLRWLDGRRWLVQHGFMPRYHAFLADPPYHLESITERFGKDDSAPAQFGSDGAFSRASRGFMGMTWDGGDIAFRKETWAAFHDFLYPGAFGMAFASTRGYHRMAAAIEDAGYILHPMIVWSFGSGFPKATRVKDDARFEGHRYGLQALKPSLEPIVVFQKPYEGRPLENIMQHGAGVLNIEAGRIGVERPDAQRAGQALLGTFNRQEMITPERFGRWPANFILSHAPECVCIGVKRIKNGSGSVSGDEPSQTGVNVYRDWGRVPFERYADDDGMETVEDWRCVDGCPMKALGLQSGESVSTGGRSGHTGMGIEGGFKQDYYGDKTPGLGDTGTAARYFYNADYMLDRLEDADPFVYAAKASRAERDAGLSGFETKAPIQTYGDGLNTATKVRTVEQVASGVDRQKVRNTHPTVKPLALLHHLASLLLPPDAYAPRRILIPFAGSGSEMIAAQLAGWEQVDGIEREAEYVAINEARRKFWSTFKTYAAAKAALPKPQVNEVENKPTEKQLELWA
jgi:hypothetical protein